MKGGGVRPSVGRGRGKFGGRGQKEGKGPLGEGKGDGLQLSGERGRGELEGGKD